MNWFKKAQDIRAKRDSSTVIFYGSGLNKFCRQEQDTLKNSLQLKLQIDKI